MSRLYRFAEVLSSKVVKDSSVAVAKPSASLGNVLVNALLYWQSSLWL